MNRLESLLAFHREDPDDAFTLFALAMEYANGNEVELALKYYLSLVDKHPNYVGTYYHLGKLFEAMEREDEARKAYETGIRISGEQNDFHARSELQSALLEMDTYDLD